MAIDFKLPELGENIKSGDVVSVLVKEGDQIQANQGVVELETDKAVVEVPCPHAGRVTKIHVQKKQTVPIGGLLISIEADAPAGGEKKPAQDAPQAKAAEPEAKQPKTEEKPAQPKQEAPQPAAATTERESAPVKAPPQPVRNTNGGPSPAAPATRRFARELGVDLSMVTGSGPGGRITRDDVKQAVRQSNKAGSGGQLAVARGTAPVATGGDRDNWGPVEREPLTKIRKTIAANMSRSHNTIPHVTNFDDADITELERIRKGSMSDYVDKNVKLTMMAFVMKAVAHALKLHPAVNASLDLENEQVVYKQYVNLGVAVDTDRGLVVPVMRSVDRMTIPQIAQGLTNIATQARNNQFALDDLRGGTFTISNLGMYGIEKFNAIVNPPQAAILAVGSIVDRVVPVDGQAVIQPMMTLTLSCDHRVVDGARAALFLQTLTAYLEEPLNILE